MKAAVYERYGGPERLRIADVPIPTPGAGQVVIKVAATSLNLSDVECLHGSPLYVRIGGLRRPARPILGSDIAGTVTAVGQIEVGQVEVGQFKVGDEVYGDNLGLKGGFAEYALAPVTALALKPKELTFAQASTIPQAGAIALQGMAGAARGDRVLINGGGGGSGTFAIQLAKRAGAHVTAVDNGSKLDYMRSLGADEVINYRSDDFTRIGQQWDVILDLVSHGAVSDYRRALAPGGRYQCVGGSVSALLKVAILGPITGRLTRERAGRRLGVLAVSEGPEHFDALAQLCVSGELTVHVDRSYTLDETAQALEHVGSGRALGKVVVLVG